MNVGNPKQQLTGNAERACIQSRDTIRSENMHVSGNIGPAIDLDAVTIQIHLDPGRVRQSRIFGGSLTMGPSIVMVIISIPSL